MKPRTDFSLFLLGTKALIEERDKNGQILRMPGYERGETLNAIYRSLNGEEGKEKYLVSGPGSLATDLDEKIALGLMAALKALSDGKTTLKLIGHSRGAISAILISHLLSFLIPFFKKTKQLPYAIQFSEFKQLYQEEIMLFQCDAYLKDILKNHLQFSHKQGVFFCAVNGSRQSTLPDAKETAIFMECSISTLIDQLNQNEINVELFCIDPVPGQNLLVGQWSLNEFYNLPPLVKNAEIIYMRDERTALFDPVFPTEESLSSSKIKITSLPGHHGTACGWLETQDSKALAFNSEQKSAKGSEARHVQKLTLLKILCFLGTAAFQKTSDLKKTLELVGIKKNGPAPIEETLISYLEKSMAANALKKIQETSLKLYAKIKKADEAYQKFRNSSYPSLSTKNERSVLHLGKKTNYDQVSELNHFTLHFVNKEHIHLALQNDLAIPGDHHMSRKENLIFYRDQLNNMSHIFNNATKEHKELIEKILYDDKSRLAYSGLYLLFLEKSLNNARELKKEKNTAVYNATLDTLKKIIIHSQELISALAKYSVDKNSPSLQLKALLEEISETVKRKLSSNILDDFLEEQKNIHESQTAHPLTALEQTKSRFSQLLKLIEHKKHLNRFEEINLLDAKGATHNDAAWRNSFEASKAICLHTCDQLENLPTSQIASVVELEFSLDSLRNSEHLDFFKLINKRLMDITKVIQTKEDHCFLTQLKKLDRQLKKQEDKAITPLLKTIRDHCLKALQEDPEKNAPQLTHTLKLVNDFSRLKPAERNPQLLLNEARHYVHSKSASRKKLGSGLLLLATLALSATLLIATGALGFGLIPLALSATLTASAFTASGYTFFSARNPIRCGLEAGAKEHLRSQLAKP